MSVAAVVSLLSKRIGLDPESVGRRAVTGAVERRMEASAGSTPAQYLDLLNSSEDEWGRLVHEIVVPETWFFRDEGSFALLRRAVTTEWPRAQPRGVFRVLSAACSTGEEPYSIAMTLLDAGLTAGDFHIDAVDISGSALAKCEHGIYGAGSFRTESLAFRDRYFEAVDGGYRLAPEVKAAVQSQQGNLLDMGFQLSRPYDVIFCRNLLIYLTADARERVIGGLYRFLEDRGYLFTGLAETSSVLGSRFSSVRWPGAFAHRKVEAAKLGNSNSSQSSGRQPRRRTAAEPSSLGRRGPLSRSAGILPRASRAGQGPSCAGQDARAPEEALAVPGRARTAIASDTEDTERLLANAKRLGDEGRLDEAVTACDTLVRERRADAGCYCLLGLLHDALGREHEAEESFRRSLYLDPHDQEALVHLILHLERKGNATGAAVLRERVERTPGIASRREVRV